MSYDIMLSKGKSESDLVVKVDAEPSQISPKRDKSGSSVSHNLLNLIFKLPDLSHFVSI